MKNCIFPEGEVITITASGTISSGDPVLMTDIVGIAQNDAVSGDLVTVALEGVYEVTKLSTDTPAVGQALYWDAGNSRFTTTASTHKKAGYAWKAEISGATTVLLRLTQ